MTLFSAEELSKKRNQDHGSGSISLCGKNHVFIGRANQKLEKIIGKISPDESCHFASMGDWSTHDLLFYLLQITGPARVYFTTWAISEYAIRQLYHFIEQGYILELKGIFDYRNGVHKPAELQFLKKITTDIKAAKCHAKVTVIENEKWGITIIGSSNYTRNPRIEAGVICSSRRVAEFHKNWIVNELNNTSCFDRDNKQPACRN